MKIEAYDFGEITIDGKKYTSDVIIYPDRIDSSWWRREGHTLYPEDIREALDLKPEVIIIGIGYSGVMVVPQATKEYIEKKNIQMIIENTTSAWKKYNELAPKKKVVACLHLTC